MAGSDTTSGNQITWVPLIDASGSTIALVNAASTQSPPATTYTYDPSGNPTLSGTTNYWPFLYNGLEKEFSDPGPFYYSGTGQFYSPQLVRSLSEVGQTSSSGPGPSGNSIAAPSGGGQQSYWSWVGQQDANLLKSLLGPNLSFNINETSYYAPSGPIVQGIESLISFFDSLFGGSDNPPTPRQLLHGRHPLYDQLLGVSRGLTPSEATAAEDPPAYPTVDAAVRAVQPAAVSRFRTNGGREAYGYIYPSGNSFTYTGPFDAPGRFGGEINVPSGFAASYHTHSESGLLSKSDEVFLNQSGKPMYILTVLPNGEPPQNGGIFRYMPGHPTEPYMLP